MLVRRLGSNATPENVQALVSLVKQTNPAANIYDRLIVDLWKFADTLDMDPFGLVAIACLQTGYDPFRWGAESIQGGSLIRFQRMALFYSRSLPWDDRLHWKQFGDVPAPEGMKALTGQEIDAAAEQLSQAHGAMPPPVPPPEQIQPIVVPSPPPPSNPSPDPVEGPSPEPAPRERPAWLRSVERAIKLIDSKPVWFILGLAVPAPVIHVLDVALDAVLLFIQGLF